MIKPSDNKTPFILIPLKTIDNKKPTAKKQHISNVGGWELDPIGGGKFVHSVLFRFRFRFFIHQVSQGKCPKTCNTSVTPMQN